MQLLEAETVELLIKINMKKKKIKSQHEPLTLIFNLFLTIKIKDKIMNKKRCAVTIKLPTINAIGKK